MSPNNESPNEKGLILRVAYLHSAGVKQSEIADQFKISLSMVSRLIKESRQYVKLSYDMPRETELETLLIARFGLAQAVVVEGGDEKTELRVVGQRAAIYFDENVRDGDGVAFSCGETLHTMLDSLPAHPERSLTISQLSIECDPEYIHQAPATLAGILRGKSSGKSFVYGIQLPPPGALDFDTNYRTQLARCSILQDLRKRAAESKFIFIGVGAPNMEGGTFQRLVKTIGVSDQNAFLNSLNEIGIVSEINNQLLDANGQDRTTEITQVADRIVTILSTEEFRSICQNARKEQQKKAQYIVAVAAGEKKAKAIEVVLSHDLANVVITSRATAELILGL